MLQAITLKLKPWKLKPLKALIVLEGMQQCILILNHVHKIKPRNLWIIHHLIDCLQVANYFSNTTWMKLLPIEREGSSQEGSFSLKALISHIHVH